MPLIREEFEDLRWLLPHIKHHQSIGNLNEDTSLHNPSIKHSEMSYDLERGSVSHEDLDKEIEYILISSSLSSFSSFLRSPVSPIVVRQQNQLTLQYKVSSYCRSHFPKVKSLVGCEGELLHWFICIT